MSPSSEPRITTSELDTARAMVLALPDAAVLYDADLKLVAYNLPWQELTGLRHRALSASLAKGASPFDLVRTAEGCGRETARNCLTSGRPLHLAELTVLNSEGVEFTAQVSFMPVPGADGKAVGVIQSVRDVSDEARVQARYRELLDLARQRAETLEREVDKRTGELSAALEAVTRLSREDPLTTLLNRRSFTEMADRSLRLAARHGRTMGLLLGDLDRFKRINDTLGHQVGDAVLQATSKALVSAVRGTDLVGRFGGEEFIILLDETASDTVFHTADRCRLAVATAPPVAAGISMPTISMGAAIFPQHGSTLDELVSHADAALYHAKHLGRNRVVLFDPSEPAPAQIGPTGSRLRVLVVSPPHAASWTGDGDEGRGPTGVAATLRDEFEVVTADSVDAGVERCEESAFDVVVADFPQAHDGVDFLRRVLRVRPASMRALVLQNEDEFAEIRGTTLARVDCFLSRREEREQVVEAVRHALIRREIDRQRLYLANEDVRRLFSDRLAELDRLIDQAAIKFAYQPIVDASSGEVRAYEALCRAEHPVFHDATVLFEAALQSGNLWRLGRLCRQIAMERLGNLASEQLLFVNLHPAELDDPELLSRAMDSLAAERVVLEITERAAIPDFKRFRTITQGLADRGYRLAVDDLGAGYASLSAVALLEPAFVKLDMSMVRGIHRSRHKTRLVGRMVEFANDVGIELVAEGVETPEEARAVRELGCHMAQGFFFGRPSTAL